MYETQTLWDEYMAESAAIFIDRNPSKTLLVIAGTGHVKGRVALPDRIAKRVVARRGDQYRPFVIVPEQVEWSAENGLPMVQSPLSDSECDWAWYTEREILQA
jgi:uncharacterized iron-regulated protein